MLQRLHGGREEQKHCGAGACAIALEGRPVSAAGERGMPTCRSALCPSGMKAEEGIGGSEEGR